ncbi:MAG TPA: hypothetical protein V6C91_11360 [Coleofasciculaceae cyanobacterium]
MNCSSVNFEHLGVSEDTTEDGYKEDMRKRSHLSFFNPYESLTTEVAATHTKPAYRAMLLRTLA